MDDQSKDFFKFLKTKFDIKLPKFIEESLIILDFKTKDAFNGMAEPDLDGFFELIEGTIRTFGAEINVEQHLIDDALESMRQRRIVNVNVANFSLSIGQKFILTSVWRRITDEIKNHDKRLNIGLNVQFISASVIEKWRAALFREFCQRIPANARQGVNNLVIDRDSLKVKYVFNFLMLGT